MHPFYEGWRAVLSYHTDAGVFQVMVRGASWDEELFGSYANGQFTPVPRSRQTITGAHLYISHLQISGPLQTFRCTPPWVMHRTFSPTWKNFYRLSYKQKFLCEGSVLICRYSPACTNKPEAHQRGSSKASYLIKYSAPMIPDAGLFCMGTHHRGSYAGLFCMGTHHRGSYAGHLHTHRRMFGTCLTANSNTFPLESQNIHALQSWWGMD
ncbi:hypothetical protein O181_039157 [Austropuccinia psidii MF-1]|uniref:Uncharacterized protein n=1 Tax=Austropuccinia psidii MF-1 TaxID=1389203 RepID=A0A9Q3DG74_9BASI|nr:hypothetical protein [Austropuccinia psidii MF-1]